jgi:predicted Zn-dependent protease
VTAAAPLGGSGVAAESRPATIADQVLELVRAQAAGAEADVHVIADGDGLTRFASSFVHQNVAEENLRVRLRVAVDGRWAVADTNRVDAASLAGLVGSTVDAARLRPVDPAFAGMAPPAPAATAGNWDEATAATTPDQRAAVVRDFVAAAGGLETAGYVATTSERAAYANTAGQLLAGHTTSAVVDGIARTGSSDGVARQASVRLADLSGADAGAAAAVAARSGARPTDLEPGDYEVVLAPSCVVDMLKFLGVHGFSGRSVAEGRSFVRLGATQFDPVIDLWDDATDPLSMSLPYDADGTPHRRVDLVVDGVTSAVVHDRRTAAAAGTSSTGHAVLGGEQWGPFPTDLRLAPGDGGSLADLAGRVERGLLVSDFWYTRILDPRTTVVTGLTRNGVWLVEGGEVVRPVRNLRFTQSYVDALGPGAVLGVGSVAAALADRWTGGLSVVPSLHLARWHFTGGATG